MQASWVDGASNDAPLKSGSEPRLALTQYSNTQGGVLCAKVSNGGSIGIEETNIPASGEEGDACRKMLHSMRTAVSKVGLGMPVRLSAYCHHDDDHGKWNFCFADLLQLNSVDRPNIAQPVPVGSTVAGVTSPIKIDASTTKPTTKKKKKKVSDNVPTPCYSSISIVLAVQSVLCDSALASLKVVQSCCVKYY